MKKMSEVFELPIDATEGSGLDAIEWASKVGIYQARKHAARAINHVDALADALAYALDVLAHCKADAGYSSRQTKAAIAGNEALKAYRGEK